MASEIEFMASQIPETASAYKLITAAFAEIASGDPGVKEPKADPEPSGR